MRRFVVACIASVFLLATLALPASAQERHEIAFPDLSGYQTLVCDFHMHTIFYEKKWLHGMEVCNGDSYYPSAHKWCLEKGLTMLGNSDIHAPDINDWTTPEEHRTLTLVFVKEATLNGLKEPLFAGRTAVWHQSQMIGRPEGLDVSVTVGE